MHNKSLAELSILLEQKKCSSVELTRHFLDRINTLNPSINAFISIQTEAIALEQAKAADAMRQAGNGTALTGIPFAHKDIFCTNNNLTTTCGSKMLSNFTAPYDATVVQKTNAAGMVMLGKTNMDEFAMGSSGENSYFKASKNPWNTDYTPGGSSSGSSSAVAARMVPAATGTDTGGSIRQPAALTGITGLKPTYGRVSRYGMVAFASSLDQGGPMTQTAEDAALMMNVIAGFDERDSTSADVKVPDYTVTLNEPLKGLKIGLPKQYFPDDLNADVAKRMDDVIKTYKKLGATFHSIDLPNSHLGLSVYYILAPAECSSNLSRYDGVRFGYRCENPKDLNDLYTRSRTEGFGEEVKRRILIGTYVLSSGYYDAYYLKAQRARHLIQDDFANAFEKVDVILGPTTPNPAFKLGEKLDDPVSMYLNDIFTININLAGLPALSLPCGFVDNLPVGFQLIGKHFDESRLLNAGHQYQQQTDWHSKTPEGV